MDGGNATNHACKPVAVIVGATSKWQPDGANTKLIHGSELEINALPPSIQWSLGGALALKFSQEGYFVVLTTRKRSNARGLARAVEEQGGECLIVELDLSSEESISSAFAKIREEAGDPRAVIYNAGYMEGRNLPPEMELLEHFPTELFDSAQHVASRGPFLIAKAVLPAMRKMGSGSLLFSNNAYCLRGRKRMTGKSLYYPRVMMRALAQALTEEYSALGVHVANIIVDGIIDAPGVRILPIVQENPNLVLNPAKIAEAFYYLHTQDRSCWTHEIQLTPFVSTLSF